MATQASWSFVIDDRARAAELLVDGRTRLHDCDRAGRTLRCELRGLFPGGHTVEVRLPGAVLERSVVIGKEWPARPALVRVRSADEAGVAAAAGADGVIASGALDPAELGEIALAAHARGVRFLVTGDARAVETAGADGILGGALPPALVHRFPEARALSIDAAGSSAIARFAAGAPAETAALLGARGLVEGKGLLGSALALLAPKGAIVDRDALGLLGPRKRHAALREGAATLLPAPAGQIAFTLTHDGDRVTVLVNGKDEPWSFHATALAPLDLLGSEVRGDEITVRRHDVAMIVASPAPDRTRF